MADVFILFLKWLRRALNPGQLCVLCVGLTVLLGFYCMKTFASNETVETMRVEILESELYDIARDQCRSTDRSGYSRRMQELKRRYSQLTGVAYSTDCQDL